MSSLSDNFEVIEFVSKFLKLYKQVYDVTLMIDTVGNTDTSSRTIVLEDPYLVANVEITDDTDSLKENQSWSVYLNKGMKVRVQDSEILKTEFGNYLSTR